ncbi:hypothetical protein BgiMline_012765 [Biomphalaria glabrata]|nr:hypothetical protein BgiMline_016614 [Biomphalaria glabrata]
MISTDHRHMSDSAPEIIFNLKNRKPPDQITLPIVEQVAHSLTNINGDIRHALTHLCSLYKLRNSCLGALVFKSKERTLKQTQKLVRVIELQTDKDSNQSILKTC